jgi:hypothetical protein
LSRMLHRDSCAGSAITTPGRKATESMGCIQDCFLLRQVQGGNQARFREIPSIRTSREKR